MVHLEALAPRVEQYSIDEMFLDVRGIDSCIDFEDFDQQLREHVRNGTGLTIGVGMGPTKTLAKSTQWASKEWPQFGGVLALTPDNIRRAEVILSLDCIQRGIGNGSCGPGPRPHYEVEKNKDYSYSFRIENAK